MDRESYLAGVEDVVLILKDELKKTKNKEVRRILMRIIESVEEKKLWMARQRIFGY